MTALCHRVERSECPKVAYSVEKLDDRWTSAEPIQRSPVNPREQLMP
jgi:hypothetical protein